MRIVEIKLNPKKVKQNERLKVQVKVEVKVPTLILPLNISKTTGMKFGDYVTSMKELEKMLKRKEAEKNGET